MRFDRTTPTSARHPPLTTIAICVLRPSHVSRIGIGPARRRRSDAHLILVNLSLAASLLTGRELRAQSLSLLFIADAVTADAQDARAGFQLGVTEARATARLLGWHVRASERTCTAAVPCVADRASVVVAAISDSQTITRLKAPALLVVASGALLDSDCLVPRRAFEVSATPGQRESAVREWRRGSAKNDGDSARAVMWSSHARAFGAEQLNARFERSAHRPMTEAAWSGWFAVKVTLEAALRAQSTDPRIIAATLGDTAFRVDGHRGVPLRFDDGVLRQPMLIENGGDGDAGMASVAATIEDSVPARGIHKTETCGP